MKRKVVGKKNDLYLKLNLYFEGSCSELELELNLSSRTELANLHLMSSRTTITSFESSN